MAMAGDGKINNRFKEIMHRLKPYWVEMVFALVILSVLIMWGICSIDKEELRRRGIGTKWESFRVTYELTPKENPVFVNPANPEESCFVVEEKEYQKLEQRLLSNRYIALESYEGRKKEFENYSCGGEKIDYSKYEVNIYDMLEQKTVKTYDLLAMSEVCRDNWQISSESWISYYLDEQGNPMSRVAMDRIIEEDTYIDKYFYWKDMTYNLETEDMELTCYEKFGWSDTAEEWKNRWRSKTDYEEDTIPNQCYRGDITWQQGYAVLYVPTEHLPEQNTELYQRFPGLEECPREEGKGVIFVFGGYPEPEEILPLFAEE